MNGLGNSYLKGGLSSEWRMGVSAGQSLREQSRERVRGGQPVARTPSGCPGHRWRSRFESGCLARAQAHSWDPLVRPRASGRGGCILRIRTRWGRFSGGGYSLSSAALPCLSLRYMGWDGMGWDEDDYSRLEIREFFLVSTSTRLETSTSRARDLDLGRAVPAGPARPGHFDEHASVGIARRNARRNPTRPDRRPDPIEVLSSP